MSTIGKRIKDAREALEITQEDLGRECGWGEEAQSRISNYERNKREPTVVDFVQIAKVLGQDPAYLAFGAPQIEPAEFKILLAYRGATAEGKKFILKTCDAARVKTPIKLTKKSRA